mgnify:CR=1 FL=1
MRNSLSLAVLASRAELTASCSDMMRLSAIDWVCVLLNMDSAWSRDFLELAVKVLHPLVGWRRLSAARPKTRNEKGQALA